MCFILCSQIYYFFTLQISDTIKTDISFYYRNLTMNPLKYAVIGFSVACKHVNIKMDIYTTADHKNIQKYCSSKCNQ